jgi:hypothetical protein
MKTTIYERQFFGTNVNVAVRETAAGGFEAGGKGLSTVVGRTKGRALRRLKRANRFSLMLGGFPCENFDPKTRGRGRFGRDGVPSIRPVNLAKPLSV